MIDHACRDVERDDEVEMREPHLLQLALRRGGRATGVSRFPLALARVLLSRRRVPFGVFGVFLSIRGFAPFSLLGVLLGRCGLRAAPPGRPAEPPRRRAAPPPLPVQRRTGVRRCQPPVVSSRPRAPATA